MDPSQSTRPGTPFPISTLKIKTSEGIITELNESDTWILAKYAKQIRELFREYPNGYGEGGTEAVPFCDISKPTLDLIMQWVIYQDEAQASAHNYPNTPVNVFEERLLEWQIEFTGALNDEQLKDFHDAIYFLDIRKRELLLGTFTSIFQNLKRRVLTIGNLEEERQRAEHEVNSELHEQH